MIQTIATLLAVASVASHPGIKTVCHQTTCSVTVTQHLIPGGGYPSAKFTCTRPTRKTARACAWKASHDARMAYHGVAGYGITAIFVPQPVLQRACADVKINPSGWCPATTPTPQTASQSV